MLMVVFGAGASYDSVPSCPPNRLTAAKFPDRPPLAAQLFDDRKFFVEAISRFPRCQPIIPYLRKPTNRTVEQVLEELQSEADKYPERHCQLAAIRYYLHFMLWGCQQGWNIVASGVTNYKTLLDQIEHRRKPDEPVCLVTFNYDTMLEEALSSRGIQIGDLSSYLASEFRLIKLHGSVNWAREVDQPGEKFGLRPNENANNVAQKLIDNAPDLRISQRYRTVNNYPMGISEGVPLFPAIAIPVETKRDFECPSQHIEALTALIPEVTKLLVIGWRATEQPFLKLLSENLGRNLQVMVVAESDFAARETINNLKRAVVNGNYRPAGGGFSLFIANRTGDSFLKE